MVAGGEPRQAVIGEFDADMLFFVEYPDWVAFQAMIADPEYRQVLPWREKTI